MPLLTPMAPLTPLTPTSPSSPTSPASISPEALDDKLRHYVSLYGVRWALIRAHMQCAFQCAFPARYLEKRWALMVESGSEAVNSQPSELRSPLTAVDNDDVNTIESEAKQIPNEVKQMPSAGAGIQERLPLKRRNDGGVNSPVQPARPPPPPSPRTPPKALLGRRCPTFLLAPGSSLAAPDNVRRQLKAVYLASKLNENRWVVSHNSENDDEESGTECASDEEKGAIVALLARELALFKRRGHSSGSGSSLSRSSASASALHGSAALGTAALRSPATVASSKSLLNANRGGGAAAVAAACVDAPSTPPLPGKAVRPASNMR